MERNPHKKSTGEQKLNSSKKPLSKPNTRPNYHKEITNPQTVAPVTIQRAKNEIPQTSSGDPERGDQRYSRNPSSKIRSPAEKQSPMPQKEEEPRFDYENYTKSATAFNIGTNLSQSQLKIMLGDMEESSFTEKILEKNDIRNFTGKIPPRALSSEERAFTQCTFRPQLSKTSKQYTNVQPRLLKHFDQTENPRPTSARDASFIRQSFNHVSEDQSLFDGRLVKSNRPVMGHSNSTDRLGVSIGGISSDFANMSCISNMHSCFDNMKVSVFEKPNQNFFDIKSNKKLGYILQHGYSFRQHEKKHYKTKQSVDAYRRAGKEFLNITMQNRSVMEALSRQSSNDQKTLNMSASSQNLYADLFTERYKKMTRSIMEDLKGPNVLEAKNDEQIEESANLVTEDRVAEEFNNAKKNRMYKELGINLNLKEIFTGLNYNDLMKLRKLHVLYATQKIKPRTNIQSPISSPTPPKGKKPESEQKSQA